jgi:SLT domain-containing protein
LASLRGFQQSFPQHREIERHVSHIDIESGFLKRQQHKLGRVGREVGLNVRDNEIVRTGELNREFVDAKRDAIAHPIVLLEAKDECLVAEGDRSDRITSLARMYS